MGHFQLPLPAVLLCQHTHAVPFAVGRHESPTMAMQATRRRAMPNEWVHLTSHGYRFVYL